MSFEKQQINYNVQCCTLKIENHFFYPKFNLSLFFFLKKTTLKFETKTKLSKVQKSTHKIFLPLLLLECLDPPVLPRCSSLPGYRGKYTNIKTICLELDNNFALLFAFES